jgi:hypothetical protein
MTIEIPIPPKARIMLDVVKCSEYLAVECKLHGTVVAAMQYSEYTDLHVDMDDGSRIWLRIADTDQAV